MDSDKKHLFHSEMEQRGVTPLEDYPGSSKPWKCKCQACDMIVYPRYYTVVKAGKGGCNPCAKKASAETRRAAAEAGANAMAKRLRLKPLEKYPGAHKIWKLKCEGCGAVTQKKANGVLSGRGCLSCSSRRRGDKRKIDNSQIAVKKMMAAGLTPLVPYPGANNSWLSRCNQCSQIVSPRYGGIVSGQGGCVACGIRRRSKSRATTEVEALSILLSADAEPRVKFPGAALPWKALCLRCGLSISPSLQNIKAGHKACRRCAMVQVDSSFDFFGEATFYLVENRALKAQKIGITGKYTKRLKDHKANGWNLVKAVNTPYGYQVWYAEAKVLAWIRADLGLPACVNDEEMPQGGFTETFPIGSISQDKVWAKVLEEISSPSIPIPTPILDGTAKVKSRRSCSLVITGDACRLVYYSNGYCKKHYAAWKNYGDPTASKKIKYPNTSCEVIEDSKICGKPKDRKGLCSVHYYRAYVYGDPSTLLRPTPQKLPKSCEVKGCKGKPYSLKKCLKHYHQARRSQGKR